ncbi:MAG TPA: nuclear transport factor 2 family protein [Caulobacteraceae bacterium]|jgi:hypothetical protein|nr:nuclear transport factor 2 family protein [Caulobacteraceae bacterium]
MRNSVACALVLSASLVTVASASPNPESQRTVEGVRAVEAHWTRAFLGGDEAYLSSLLDPAYVSVNAGGVARSKADIIALAKKIAASPPRGPTPTPNLKIVIHGDAAIAIDSSGGGQASSDVFYWQAGRWHAWYSQHTTIKPAS